jgi:prepilin-type N-terminal cleavage/methylation domain-containing protein
MFLYPPQRIVIKNRKSAFSLVELSIVLVILGLLTGGILTGQSLIKAAELRSVSTEIATFQTAVMTFKQKYFALPGDIKNATAFWGDNTAYCNDGAVTNGIPGTCNGNGDGILDDAGGGDEPGENFMFWNHLSNAQLIEGQYTGISGSANQFDAIIGENIPPSIYSSGGWWTDYLDIATGAGSDNMYLEIDFGNILVIGAATNNDVSEGKLFTPEQVWNIDKKLDDGRPASGKVMGLYWDNECFDALAADNFSNSNYLLDSTSIECAIVLPNIFR